MVRLVLVPAAMKLLGRLNWWLPAWLDRLLPRLEGHQAYGVDHVPQATEPVSGPVVEGLPAH